VHFVIYKANAELTGNRPEQSERWVVQAVHGNALRVKRFVSCKLPPWTLFCFVASHFGVPLPWWFWFYTFY